jgi:hypothetical protein
MCGFDEFTSIENSYFSYTEDIEIFQYVEQLAMLELEPI